MSSVSVPTPATSSSVAPPQQMPSASLYVGDLHPDVTEAMLFEVFREIGPIVSIRVCRDAVTRLSLGYGYVNYQNGQDAERAIEALNFSSMKDKPVRIMWSHRDPAIRKSGVGNIFIKSLDKSIDNKALYDTFSAFGNILSCKVATDSKGSSKGYGFVHFDTQEAADQAISKVNGMLLNDKQVFVGSFVRRSDRDSSNSTERPFTNIYIKNLDASVDETLLRQLFAEFGDVTSLLIERDENGVSRGFSFINFKTPESARAAVEKMNGAMVNGKTVFVGRAQKKSEREAELRARTEQARLDRLNRYQGVNLYVKNLDETIDENKLKQEFTAFGSITSAVIMRDDKGVSKGFGFVCYSNQEEASKALTEMNGKMIGAKPIYVALAQKKEYRRVQLEAQHATSRYMPQGGVASFPVVPGPGFAPPFVFPGGNAAAYMRGYPAPGATVGPRRGGGNAPVPSVAPVNAAPAPAGPWNNPPVPGAYSASVRGGASMRGGNVMRGGASMRGGVAPGGAPMGANAANRGNFKYNRNVRNMRPDSQFPPMMGMPMNVAPAGIPGADMSLTTLAQMPREQQTQIIGSQLYPRVHQLQPEHASKITGMLLEMEVAELLRLLESAEALKESVDEAVGVLTGGAQE